MCTKFQVCIVFGVARKRDTNKYTITQTQVKLGISSTGCSPHVDFDKKLILGLAIARDYLFLCSYIFFIFQLWLSYAQKLTYLFQLSKNLKGHCK